jgi:hypothetical protein
VQTRYDFTQDYFNSILPAALLQLEIKLGKRGVFASKSRNLEGLSVSYNGNAEKTSLGLAGYLELALTKQLLKKTKDRQKIGDLLYQAGLQR